MAENYVEGRIFNSEVKRLDSEIGQIKKTFDSFETRTERAIAKLDEKFDAKIDKLEAKIEKLDSRLWSLMAAIIVSIIVQIALKYL